MANVQFRVSNSAAKTCAAGVETPILMVKAASNHRALVYFVDITFSGNAPTAVPPVVALYRASSDGTGGDSVSPVKCINTDPETLQVTALEADWTAEAFPSVGTLLHKSHVHPQGGRVFNHLLGVPIELLGDGTNHRLLITVNAPAEVTCLANIEGAE